MLKRLSALGYDFSILKVTYEIILSLQKNDMLDDLFALLYECSKKICISLVKIGTNWKLEHLKLLQLEQLKKMRYYDW